jgi:hypothetical protein
VAALMPGAQAAREEAGRLRGEAHALTLALRQSAAHSRAQLETAEAAMNRLQTRRYEPLPSPWSPLLWRLDAEALEGVLVALP